MSLIQGILSYIQRGFRVTGGGQMLDNLASDSGERVDELSVLGLSTAWACVNLLAGTVGSLPLTITKPGPSGVAIEAPEHPLYRILHDAPNAEQTTVDFWEGAQASLELKGNAVARKMRGSGGQLIGLSPMAWDFLQITRNSDGDLIYRYDGETLPSGEVLHIRGFGGSPLGGLSTIAFGANTFGTARAVDRAAGTMFRNGIRPSGILSTTDKLKKDQRDEVEELLQRKFSGALNAGRPMVLDNGLTWSALTMNPNDAQMLESREFSVEDICRLFGTPPHMIGHTAGNSQLGSSISEQTLGFNKFVLRRRCRRIEKAAKQQLLSPADLANGVDISFDMRGLMRGDDAARTAYYQSALMNGWMTINEVRKLEGLAPIAGGDVPHLQMQQIPISLAGGKLVAGNGGQASLPAA
jgi:HK97 family phage portal protein